jgi:hypothetical protein
MCSPWLDGVQGRGVPGGGGIDGGTLAGELGYQEAPAVTRRFTTNEPFPLDIDLTSLPISRAQRMKKVDQ